MLDIQLPAQLQATLPGQRQTPLFLCDYRRDTPSPRYRITLDTHLVSLVVAGQKHLIGAQESRVFAAGTCLLFRRGRCLSADLCSGNKGYHSVLLFFDDTQVSAFKQRYRDLLDGNRSTPPGGACLSFEPHEFTARFADALSRSLTSPGGLTVRQQALSCEQILLHLVELGGRRVIDFLETPATQEEPSDRIDRVVGQHALANLTVEELAFLCGMSVATFKRQFFRRHGMSPGRWQRIRLLEHAAHLLREENLAPADVYWRVGYSSPSSFTKAFREHHRRTPAAFRQGAGEMSQARQAG